MDIQEKYRIGLGKYLGFIVLRQGVFLYSDTGRTVVLDHYRLDNMQATLKSWERCIFFSEPSMRVCDIKLYKSDIVEILKYSSLRKAVFRGIFGNSKSFFKYKNTELCLTEAGQLYWITCPLEEKESWDNFCDRWNNILAVRKPHEKVCANCGHAIYFEDRSVGIPGGYECDNPQTPEECWERMADLPHSKGDKFEGCPFFKEASHGCKYEGDIVE